MRSRSLLLTVAVALLAALTLAAPVAAADRWVTARQAGTHAFAYNDDCADNPDGSETCGGQSIDVFEGRTSQSGEPTLTGEQVCYGEYTFTYDPVTGQPLESSGRFGCALGGNTVSIERLDAITLAPTVIELTSYTCVVEDCTETPGGSITIHGTWNGQGPILSQRGRFRSDDGDCLQVFVDNGKSRAATFVGSMDAPTASISQGSFTSKSSCAY